ncbi:Hypothetical_protein [Hexamita inflata]|uniref:Hypothetical_protein n=1 Tax=Hexamita inflata TaxID=28002 RepID=A0AA86QQA5_9EUKA|nr:Hypothetical protein HINF_LOCUS44844 [Hexamita inflata]
MDFLLSRGSCLLNVFWWFPIFSCAGLILSTLMVNLQLVSKVKQHNNFNVLQMLSNLQLLLSQSHFLQRVPEIGRIHWNMTEITTSLYNTYSQNISSNQNIASNVSQASSFVSKVDCISGVKTAWLIVIACDKRRVQFNSLSLNLQLQYKFVWCLIRLILSSSAGSVCQPERYLQKICLNIFVYQKFKTLQNSF